MIDDRSTRARIEGERLARRYRWTRDEADLGRLIGFYRPMALALAARYTRGDRRDDVEQVACLGLVKAAKRFDPARGTCFRSYAVPVILGEVKRFWRDNVGPLHVPRAVQERMLQMRAVAARLEQREARPPTVAELAAATGCADEEVVEALAAEGSAHVLSLDGAPAQPGGVTLAEQVGGHDPGFDFIECMESIRRALPELSRVEREVIRLHFQRELTQREIGRELGITPRRVGVILARALDRLAEMLDPRPRAMPAA